MIAAGQLMAGKKGLVMGVANERSIAWGIAKACHEQGAEVAFTFQGEALEKRVRPLANSIGAKIIEPCDVTNAASIDATFSALEKKWGGLDFLVHAIAFSNKDELRGRYLETSPENFQLTMNVSCYSFTAVAQRAVPLMKNGGSLLTLTYYGAERVIPHYNVMGGRPRRAEDQGQRHLRRPDQDAGLRGDQRWALYTEVERTQLAPQTQHNGRGGRQCRSLPAVRPRHRHDR
jgi:enoyl-[acyl-carrier-protein] reductase (NADH)